MLTLTIHNNIDETMQLAPFIDQVSETYGITPDVSFKLNLAMDEALANSVSYAYPAGIDGEITLEAEVECGTVVFRLIDQGQPFDPTKDAADADITLSAEERPIGGLGIYLIKQMMDEVMYLRKGDCNILTMKKKL